MNSFDLITERNELARALWKEIKPCEFKLCGQHVTWNYSISIDVANIHQNRFIEVMERKHVMELNEDREDKIDVKELNPLSIVDRLAIQIYMLEPIIEIIYKCSGSSHNISMDNITYR